MNRFPGKLALQQRVLPQYRAPFFDLLASACEGGMSLFAGLPRALEGIATTDTLQVAHYSPAKNIHLFRGGLYLCLQAGFIDWLRDRDPDALIVEANPRYLSTPAAVRWMHERGKPVIGWGLGAPPPTPSPPINGRPPKSERWEFGKLFKESISDFGGGAEGGGGRFRQRYWATFLRQFDALIAYSQRGADEYAALGFPRERIFVAYNSVSPPPLFPLPLRPATFDIRPCILFVGRLQARKRVDALLKACAQLGSNPRLVIVGDGPDRERLQSFATEIYPRAEFIGAKHGAELKPYFAAADLFVLPGTGGLAVQEAMSYGLPVIVAQGDGTQDDLVRQGNGWQIPPGDFQALLAAMKEALSDVARLRKMGEESYRIVRDEINIAKMVERFVTALNSLK